MEKQDIDSTTKEQKERYAKEFIPDWMATEHKAWIEMFNEICEVFKLTPKELNDKKYRNIFVLIEKWAYADRMRRIERPESNKYKGCLWDGK